MDLYNNSQYHLSGAYTSHNASNQHHSTPFNHQSAAAAAAQQNFASLGMPRLYLGYGQGMPSGAHQGYHGHVSIQSYMLYLSV
jgi:hypothetical protein